MNTSKRIDEIFDTYQLGNATLLTDVGIEQAKSLIMEELRLAKLEELEMLIGEGAMGDKYRTKAKHGFITVQERIEQLKSGEL